VLIMKPVVAFTQEQKDQIKTSILVRTKQVPVDSHNKFVLDDTHIETLEQFSGSNSAAVSVGPLLSSDIVRTSTFDSSARIFKPSMALVKYNIPSVHQNVDRNSYSHPCDRLARMYTLSAAGLTMENAAKVSQFMLTASHHNKVMGFSLAATAPNAFDASVKITELAKSGSSSRVEKRKEPPKPLPSAGSPLALRENHRLIRSQPMYTLKQPISSPVTRESFDQTMNSNFCGNAFDDWNPESVDAPVEDVLSEDALYHSLPYDQKLKLKAIALDRLQKAVDYIVEKGALTASGSGSRNAIVPMSSRKIRSIVHLIPSIPGFLESKAISDLLGHELNQVGFEYVYASARACVEYDLKDKVEAENLGIHLYHLRDETIYCLWTDISYQLAEWRVLRQTSINPDSVWRSLSRMNHSLCTTLRIMQELQYLWLDGQLPSSVWEAIPYVARCSYNGLLFTQVNSMAYRPLLPLSLDEFVGKVEYHSKFIKDALCDNWLTTAGNRLSHFISNMADDTEAARAALDGLVEATRALGANDDEEDEYAPEPVDAGNSEFSKFKTMSGANPRNTAAANRALANRLAAEGLDGRTTGRNRAGGVSVPTNNSAEKKRTKAEMVVDSCVVLMSKQLRGMCERSLHSIADLFEKLKMNVTAKYTIFTINLRVRRRGSREVTSDFSQPVDMCLQPDLNDISTAMTSTIHTLVHASRNFNRPEQVVGPTFGGQNGHLVANLLANIRNSRYMNESSVALTDEVVVDVLGRVHSTLKHFYYEPSLLLERFTVLEELLSGREAIRVAKVIRDSVSSEISTIEGLDNLTKVCKELEVMMETIRTIVPDVCHFTMFEVKCTELKDSLMKQAKSMHSQILEAILEENKAHLVSIQASYQEIATTLTTEATDCAELKALQDYTSKAATLLSDLYDQYITSCFERVKFLLNHKYKLAKEDVDMLKGVFGWPSLIQNYLRKSFESQSQKKRALEEQLEEDQRRLENEINEIIKRVEIIADAKDAGDYTFVKKTVQRSADIKRDIELKQEKSDEITEREALLEVPHSDMQSKLQEVRDNLEPVDRLWGTVKQFVDKTSQWLDLPLAEIDPEDAERAAEELKRSFMKASKEFERMGDKRSNAKRIADLYCNEIKDFINETIPLMLLICNPGMKDRHWTDIEAITGLSIPKGEVLNIHMMHDIGLQHQLKEIEDICVSANKEYSLQMAMDKMESEWENMIFDTKEYRTTGTRILQGVDEIQQLLDDQIVKTQAMKGVRYIKPFIVQITRWEETLLSMQDILDNWLKVQATWLYLEPIFSSDDIMRQMPTEGKMFRAVDNTWRHSMAQTFAEPSCVKVARRQGFLESLIEANAKLEQIQKGLNDYLETKRLAFPRFFFLSNDELLEILAETKDPLRVQPHLKKCFDGISLLHFTPTMDITACFDPKGEKLDFPYEKVNHKKINPNDSGGNVELWLIEVEAMMKKSLAYAIDVSMKDYTESDRIEWLQRWQGQVVICINQTMWCRDVEKVLVDDPTGKALEEYYKKLCDELMRTVVLVRGNISKGLRIAIGALVVMDVHNRDTIYEMTQIGVRAKTDFDWLSQLRYYWTAGGASAQSGKPGTTQCRMINAMALYAYEYIGNQDRLVITPLTDRCYRTLMGAIHLNLGGAPEGPAGTGKTETTKDLAKAIAIQCVVTNCSDGLDYLAMAKFFKGLASSGAWACFDEFNRIQLEVLSVVAQQIMQIQMAKIQQLDKFIFEGTELTMQPTCCPFITMNPGYAGRAELPDNLKVLFRTVAMMVPDYAMISEIILYSYGYTSARPLSVKIVTTYKLCSEQLSSQSHYDYGMRAVIAVLRAAGNLKRSDGHLPEDVLVLRSIIDVNLPKFLSPDVPLFNGIVSDLFPGVKIDPPDVVNMRKAFDDICEKKSLVNEEYFWEKTMQIYDMMVVRHGFMIVGLPFSGKSSAWKVLAEILGLLSERFPKDKRWSKVVPVVQNPKSITMGQLYGMFDPVSHEWTDGVLAINYRNAANNRVGIAPQSSCNAEDRKWILFDGPVDAIWIENMNTVLDDNKKLCLMSGEIIAMTDVMSMMFEPMDLLVASPATVSRCGMIYMEPEKLGWRPLVTSWMHSNRKNGRFNHKEADQVHFTLFDHDVLHLWNLIDWIVEPALCFVRKDNSEMSPTVDANLVMSLLNILEALLPKAFAKYKNAAGQEDEMIEPRQAKLRQQDLECCFFFSLVWSIGKSGTFQSQTRFSKFLDDYIGNGQCLEADYGGVSNLLLMRGWKRPDFQVQSFKGTLALPMPIRQSFYECAFIPGDSKWKYWSDLLPQYTITAGISYSNIVVPNNYTAQFTYMLELLIAQKKHVLVCGPTGTGKSVYVYNTITQVLPQDKYKPLCLGFSAKTSANMTQDIIDGKLDKRKKGVYGPPLGQHSVIFVDDLNMPEVETYGAQPPIELVRQLVDSGGWYDLKEKSWRSIIDTSLVAAMGPAGGGRNSVTPRLLRHFNLFCFAEFDDTTLRRIFSTIIQWHFTSMQFPSDVRAAADAVVDATLDTYRAAMAVLLPTPQKSHYTFNLRDFSRIIQGVLLCRPSDSFNKGSLIRLWTHEALRVFGDRLTDDSDRQWFNKHLETMCATRFSAGFYDTFKHLDVEVTKVIGVNEMRSLLFGDYMSTEESKPYEEIRSIHDLHHKMEEYLNEYNQVSRKPMDLVMFGFAIEHISRVSRILKMPGGNALLVGVGGSGRQSVTRLATFMTGYNIFQIEISKNYSNVEWREDLKNVLKQAGTTATPVTFLFSDSQIKRETFVEDINNMLNNGEVPNIFPSDERAAICEAVRPFARQIYGKIAADMSAQDLYAFFISRVKQFLHIVLVFSPIGDAFRDRLRKFPALINCCTIDWFTAWPSDALVAVAQRFLSDVKFESEDTRSNIVSLCQSFHQDVINLSTSFMENLKRKNYVTPTSYLELIVAFKGNLDVKRIEVSQARMRYEVGLEKLAFAAEQVNHMQKELADLQPELIESAAATEVLMGQIEQKMPGVMETRKVVSAEAAVAQAEADIVQKQKDEVEADLAEAIPALNEAIEALNTIKPNDINEIKALSKPPEKIRMVCRAVCIMLDIKPVRIPDPENPTKRIMDYWGPSQKMLSDPNFIKQLMEYDKDNMNPKIVAEIKRDFIEHPDFKPEIIAKASQAAEGMCRWCGAMITYDRIAKIVAPKKAALAEAEAKLNATMAALNEKKAALQKVEDDLHALETQLQAAKQKKMDLESQAGQCDKKIVRANQLLDGLGGERERWGEFANQLGVRYKRLTGDVLVSAAVLAYLGPFTAVYRQQQLVHWVKSLKDGNIPCSDNPTLSATLGDAVRIRQWNIDGLPTDGFSVDNGIVVFNARRWPLMIDPQGQANKWIRNMEKANNLQVVKLTSASYLRTLENSIQFGTPVLLENVGEELDPSLEPLLQKQLFKQGGVNCIRLGDSTVEYSDNFRFYITTKLRNPHYLPEVSVKVTLLNFMITPEGLQDQLLGIVVSQERPDLEEQRNQLIVESAENKRLLKEIEDKILHIMSSSSGNILEDETAIETLKSSKVLSDEITSKQKIAEETEININMVRQSYSPVAYSSQILFFCITDLANIEPVYQYSLSWFINLFISSIVNSEKGRDVAKRLENLDSHFTFSLYKNVCRSLLEKDKMLFSFLLTTRIMGGQGKKDESEWFFLLTGGVGMDNHFPNPAPGWLAPKSWDAVCRLGDVEKFRGFKDDFIANITLWEAVYDSVTPQEEAFPGMFAEAEGLARLCALRVIRPDKVVLAIQKFVAQTMGDKFVKPPPFDLQACYNDSSAVVPLVFILSPGSDPMGAVQRAGVNMKTQVDPISLGQGQGPKAEKMILRAKQKGTWVVLQNCHLAPSWMTTLEKICEELDPDEVHPGFRLWCTTYPSDVFPVAVLQNGVKMTNEPPKGIRANLLGSFNADPIGNESIYCSCTKGFEFRRLVFGLCFFHALVQERRLYGPLGWNIPYEFNESDLRISVQQLILFLDENSFVPFKALMYTAGECNYGGRVTDDKDRRTLLCILRRFYSEPFLEDNHFISPSGQFKCPKDGSREDYIAYIDGLDLIASPEVFGLHDNATLTKDQNDTNNLLNSVIDTEGGSGGSAGGSGGVSKEDTISAIAIDIAGKIPDNYDMEFAMLKYPVLWENSMNTVVCQELIRYNNLLSLMRDSLSNVQKAIKGLVVMSSELEVFGNALFVNRIPLMWKSRSYPSLKPLSSYIADQQTRLAFFLDWLVNKPPAVFWISGFFFTQAFLTGAAQNYARKYTIPIDDVVFDFEMLHEDYYTNGPADGVYTYGLFLEGSRWDKHDRELAESTPKILFSPAPTMQWVPYRKADVPVYPHYKCPVYKTSDRRGVLATTGHSSNFVCFIHMPSTRPEDHWVQRGVAMLTQLDD